MNENHAYGSSASNIAKRKCFVRVRLLKNYQYCINNHDKDEGGCRQNKPLECLFCLI